MKKDFIDLETPQEDDDFNQLLQGFLDDAETSNADDNDEPGDDSGDDDYYDLNDDVIPYAGLRGERGYLKDVASIDVGVLAEVFDSPYSDGPVTVTIHGEKDGLFPLDRFRCYIYGEGYYPMCNSVAGCETSRPDSCSVAVEMHSSRIWMPGSYVLFVRDTKDDSLVRIPFTLDDGLHAMLSEYQECRPCSADDVLTTCIESHDDAWNVLGTMPGAAQLRRYVMESRRLKVYNEFRKAMNGLALPASGNLLITTLNGDFSELTLRSFHMLVAERYEMHYIDCSALYDATRNNPYEPLFDELSCSGPQLFCLTRIGSLLSTGGKVIVRKFMERLRHAGKDNLLWLCGTAQETGGVLDMFPSLNMLFPMANRLQQEPYSAFELVQLFNRILSEQHLFCSIDAADQLSRTIIRQFSESTISGLTAEDFRRHVVDEVRPRYLARGYREIDKERLPLVEPDDLCLEKLTGNDSYEDCLRELDEMVGLGEVKKGIRTMANNTRFFINRRSRGLPTSQKAVFHCIFTGNPGTGKTTVARKLGRLYHSLGLLSRGEVIAVDRTRLVGRYIGETEENMKVILEEARGNVLFIDEAYTLYDGASDRKDFGARVIDSLLTVLSEPDPDMLVVFAGYLKEMDAMLNTNPGLMGRFPYKYQFADYNPDELMEIATRLLERDAYILTPEAAVQLKDSITQDYLQRNENFSNARWVEQFITNGVIPAMADRIAQSPDSDYQRIEASDISRAFERFNPKAVELKPRRKVGFSA